MTICKSVKQDRYYSSSGQTGRKLEYEGTQYNAKTDLFQINYWSPDTSAKKLAFFIHWLSNLQALTDN